MGLLLLLLSLLSLLSLLFLLLLSLLSLLLLLLLLNQKVDQQLLFDGMGLQTLLKAILQRELF